MSRVRLILLVVAILALLGMLVPLVLRSRVNSDRIACENHLRLLGLIGVRHAAPPGQALPTRPRDELPPGTFLNPDLPPDERMSWYVYTLNALIEGTPMADPSVKHRPPAGLGEPLAKFDPTAAWDAPANAPLASYRLAVAICPAQVREYPAGQPVPTNYLAGGGLGLITPPLPLDEAGPRAGAYRYHSPTPISAIPDGLHETAQIIESSTDLGPWLRGGPSTLRPLVVEAEPYVGPGRPFGGCHPGGAYVSMADGSVRFVVDGVDPVVFRAMLTIAGGPAETDFEGP